ncbi:MAG: hypothetical protein GZ091_07890 [Paludibacter sp.]|nr:hypothetical protein [Paludibacter sp.]
MEKYAQIISSLTSEQKIDFLEKVLENSKELQSQFVLYFTNNQKDKISKAINFNEKVIEMANEYQETLEALDLNEPDYERYHNRNDRYYEEWEMAQEAVEEEVAELFQSFKIEMIGQISQGNIEMVMAQFTGLLIACYEADIDDDYDNLGDSQEYFSNCLKEIEKEIEIVINRTILNNKALSETIKDTMLCFRTGEANLFSTEIHDLIMTALLKNNSESCSTVYVDCKQNTNNIELFPNTYLQATRFVNAESWVSEAEKLCTLNVGVATELLNYQSTTDKSAFHKNAKLLFPLFENKLVNLIASAMDDDYDNEFSKKVLVYKTNAQYKIDDYKRLAGLLTRNERIQYIETHRNGYSYNFYIQMLEVEKMHTEILNFAKSYNGYLSNLTIIMCSIINKYPTDCFEISKTKIAESLEKNMGRNYYHEVAVLLKFLSSEETIINSVNAVVQEICILYSRRPALRDELRQIGLLKK